MSLSTCQIIVFLLRVGDFINIKKSDHVKYTCLCQLVFDKRLIGLIDSNIHTLVINHLQTSCVFSISAIDLCLMTTICITLCVDVLDTHSRISSDYQITLVLPLAYSFIIVADPVNTKQLYTIYKMSDQRPRRRSNIV